MFKHCGSIFFAPGSNEELIMEKAIDAGAEDVEINDDGSIEVITPPNEFLSIKEMFETEKIKFEMAELTMKAENEVELSGDDGIKMQKILDVLDDLDDVQEVYTNAVIEN
jgi:transcriptional/translational regulatory protein YebC/TACO1